MVHTVWFGQAMGLLEEAIREHLELKRRSGADPGVVAREEHEALAPVPVAETGDPLQRLADELPAGGLDTADVPSIDATSVDHPPSIAASRMDNSILSQETAEIDMEALIGGATEPHEPMAVAAPSWGFEEAGNAGVGQTPAENQLWLQE